MKLIREWTKPMAQKWEQTKQLLKINGSEFPCETRPIAQTSGYNTGVRH
jgi:hypothetical protein